MVTPLNNRKILELKGSDCKKFLQNLVSNDINLLDQGLVIAHCLHHKASTLLIFL